MELSNKPGTGKIMTVRITMAPITPSTSTRFCKSAGIANTVKIISQTKTLSMANDFSIK